VNESTRQYDKKNETKRENLVSRKQRDETSQAENSPVAQILHLQKTIGNQAVTQLIQSGAIQAKLTIGKPNDIYEQEADRVADQVMRMSEGSLVSSHSSLGRKEDELEEENIKTPVFTKSETGSTPGVTPDIENSISAMKSGGQPLSESTRAFFEPRFGIDFRHVRVHTDSKAAQTAQAIHAQAYTMGNHIVFNKNQYAPEAAQGKSILAHELTHVIQQKERKERDSQEMINFHTAPIQRFTWAYTSKDFTGDVSGGRSAIQERVTFAEQKISVIIHLRDRIPEDVKRVVDKYPDGAETGDYNHYVPYNVISTRIREICQGKTREKIVEWMTDSLKKIEEESEYKPEVKPTAFKLDPLESVAAFNMWLEDAIVAICDWPKNIFRGDPKRGKGGKSLDEREDFSPALKRRLEKARETLEELELWP
jgi:hypothetical protein